MGLQRRNVQKSSILLNQIYYCVFMPLRWMPVHEMTNVVEAKKKRNKFKARLLKYRSDFFSRILQTKIHFRR